MLQNRFSLELLFWLFTAVLVVAILFPIHQSIGWSDYPFLVSNIVFVVVAVTLTRYIFMLKYTFFAKNQAAKVILIVACIPLMFYLVSELNYMQTYLDEVSLESLLPSKNLATQAKITDYIQKEMTLFGVAAIVATVVFVGRVILSVWRTKNRGSV